MLTIKSQFDLCQEDKYSPFVGGELHRDGIFLDGVDEWVLKDVNVAVRALRLIAQNEVDIFCQERIFRWLAPLHRLVVAKKSNELMVAFYEAMQVLRDGTDQQFTSRGYCTLPDREELSEIYGFGGNAAVISSGVRDLRYLANREAFKHLGYRYGDTRPPREVDYPARVDMYITRPRELAYADEFAGAYYGGATIEEAGEGRWRLRFDEYYLSEWHEYFWSMNLWKKIFVAIHPYACQLFESDFEISVIDQFSD